MTTSGKSSTSVEAAVDELKKHGAEILGIDRTAAHPKVRFRWKGTERFYSAANTPSDRRGAMNVRANIRHMLGVVKALKRTGKRRSRKHHATPPAIAAPVLTTKPDPMRALLRHECADEVLRLRLDRAWLGFWGDCMASVGANSLIAGTR